MKRVIRPATVGMAGLALFLAPAAVAHALWSTSATGTLSVTTAAPPPASLTLYLENPGSGNTASSAFLPLTTAAPAAGTLPNYDTNRDSTPGLGLKKGSDLNETDSTKVQRWRVPGPLTLPGTATVRLWSAMKDFDPAKSGAVAVGLYDCGSADTSPCTLLAQRTVAPSGAWSGGSTTWVERTWSLSTPSTTIASNRTLQLRVVVPGSSGDDMNFAYDTATYPSALTIG